jgi:hypothetical protein
MRWERYEKGMTIADFKAVFFSKEKRRSGT